MTPLLACIALSCPPILAQGPVLEIPAPRAEGFAIQAPTTFRQKAWELHTNPPTGPELLGLWENAESAEKEALLIAASRGLRKQNVLCNLLEHVLFNAVKDSKPLTPGIEGLLTATPSTPKSISLLQQLSLNSEWRISTSRTLFRWEVLPKSSDSLLAVDLLASLQNGRLPQSKDYASIFALGAEFRRSLLPLICNGTAVEPSDWEALQNLAPSNWSVFERTLLDLVGLDSLAAESLHPNMVPAPELIMQNAWRCYLEQDLALGQREVLAEGIQRHSHFLTSNGLAAAMGSLPNTAQRKGMRFLAQNAFASAAPLLLNDARNSALSSDDRNAACKALFRCGNDADIQSLLLLLDEKIDRALTRTLLAGWRLRPPTIPPGTMETMLAHLRTQEAALAVELLILTTDHTTRLSWLQKAAALPPASGRRIAQAAWAVDPHPDLVEAFWTHAKDPNSATRALGAAGLMSALSKEELANGYRALLFAATTPAQVNIYLDTIRNFQSDSALEVLIDWLLTDVGRSHAKSASFASLLIEEEAAWRLFQHWWDNPEGLNETQLDWAACNLAPQLEAARSHLRQRFGEASDRSKTMFLSRMQNAPTEQDALLWKQVIQNPKEDVSVRRVAAHLLFRLSTDGEGSPHSGIADQVWEFMLSKPAITLDRAWLVFARGMAGRTDWQWRQKMFLQAQEAPFDDRTSLLRACYQGFADAPLAEQLSSLQDQLLGASVAPGAIPLSSTERPKHQEVSQLHFEFFHLLLALRAFEPTSKEDLDLASHLLELGANIHPDRLSLLASTLTSWPETITATEKILRATEGLKSYRFPPYPQGSAKPSLSSFTQSTPFFDEFRQRYDQGEIGGLETASAISLLRWPQDRRSSLWAGWLALTSGSPQEALEFFELGLKISGWVAYAQLEPRLGMAAAQAALLNDISILSNFLKENEQSDALLRGRTVHGLLPDLSSLVAEGE